MQFDPKETDEAAKNEGFKLLPDGNYDAEVIECEEQVSAAGNDMFKITLAIADPNGGNFKHRVWDYISPKFFQKKFKAFFDSMGQSSLYQSGDIDPALLIHQYVTATIRTQPAEGQYSEKNVVETYMLAEVNAANKVVAATPAKADDGLPFTFLSPLVPFLIAFVGVGASLLA